MERERVEDTHEVSRLFVHFNSDENQLHTHKFVIIVHLRFLEYLEASDGVLILFFKTDCILF